MDKEQIQTDKKALIQLKEARKELRAKLNINIKRQEFLIRRIWHNEKGIEIGDDIEYKRQRGSLSELKICHSRALPTITLYKQDGSLGKRKINIYHQEEIKRLKQIKS